MIVFGASGDLCRRKLLPALYDLEQQRLLPDTFRIIGFSRTPKNDAAWRQEALAAVTQRFANVDTAAAERFAGRLHYVTGAYDDSRSYVELRQATGGLCACHCTSNVLFYMALPPSVSEIVLTMLQTELSLVREGAPFKPRIMMEKPFGTDLASAQRLNALLGSMFDESQIYRIDHYLAKDTVRNLMVFRFANAIFEPLWNRHYIDHVQITAAEKIDVEGRGSYYEEAGVVRDMVQNHVLQVLALVAMEPPLAGDEESLRDKTLELFKSLRPLHRTDFVFGQYQGYRAERNVSADSTTPTFAAVRLHIDNWRWEGVPFYVRSGKALERKLTEVVIRFRTVPLCILGSAGVCAHVRPNVLFLRIQPDEGIRLSFTAKKPGPTDDVDQTKLNFRYADFGDVTTESYTRVILDALRARPALFWRNDGIEAAWRFVEPMLHTQQQSAPGTYPNYTRDSWGPDKAQELICADGRTWLGQDGVG